MNTLPTATSSRLVGLIRIRVKGMQMGYATSPSKESLQPKKDAVSQGHANDPSNLQNKDPHGQSVEGGKATRKNESGGPLDAASPGKKTKPSDTGTGNPEGIGMVDQVGSAGGTAQHFEKK